MPHSAKTVDYYFSVVSPWAYIGDQRFRDIAARHGFEVRHHPMLSPQLFPATGGKPLKDRAQQRKDYRMQELKRWSQHLNLALNLNPKFFPTPEAPATQLILAARDTDGARVGALAHALMRAVWEEERNVADDDTLVQIATACQLDGAALLAASKDAKYAQAAEAEVNAAIERGVFGYPTYALGDELFWGQDRLDFLERAMEQV